MEATERLQGKCIKNQSKHNEAPLALRAGGSFAGEYLYSPGWSRKTKINLPWFSIVESCVVYKSQESCYPSEIPKLP